MTDRSDTTTVYVTTHPVRVLHVDPECSHLQRGDGEPRETKRNRYPNRDLCKRCTGRETNSKYDDECQRCGQRGIYVGDYCGTCSREVNMARLKRLRR